MVNSVGKPLDRVDGRLKVTGRALYAAEHPVPNAAAAVLVMSTIPKGRIAKLDTTEAEAAAGRTRGHDVSEHSETAATRSKVSERADQPRAQSSSG